MTTHMFDQVIVRVRAPLVGVDKLGKPQRDWAAAERVTIEPAVSVQPRVATESVGEPRSQTVTGWTINSQAGHAIDVLPTDRIEWADRQLEIVAGPQHYPHPTRPGRVHHSVVDVQIIRG